MNNLSIITAAPEETRRVGEKLARYLFSSSVVALTGGLTRGKTTLGEELLLKGKDPFEVLDKP